MEEKQQPQVGSAEHVKTKCTHLLGTFSGHLIKALKKMPGQLNVWPTFWPNKLDKLDCRAKTLQLKCDKQNVDCFFFLACPDLAAGLFSSSSV